MPLLETTALSKRFGGVSALHDVSVVLERDETLGMIGPNGSGKTTFVNAVTGNLRADSGTLMLDGVSIAGRKPNQLATLGLVRTYQAVRVFGGLTTRANLGTANLLLGDKAFSAAELAELLDWLRLDRVLDKDAGSLTLFEQRRLELAMRLVLRPKLVMLDEPVGGLAVTEVREMIKLLSELKARTTLFVIEHTMRVIRELADRVVVLVAGEKIADGPPVEILRDRRVIEQYLGTAHA
jgi:ABC-type branched-subunit amino acid transport system ATPase component